MPLILDVYIEPDGEGGFLLYPYESCLRCGAFQALGAKEMACRANGHRRQCAWCADEVLALAAQGLRAQEEGGA